MPFPSPRGLPFAGTGDPYRRERRGFGVRTPTGWQYGVPYPFLGPCLYDCDASLLDPLSAYADSQDWSEPAGSDVQTGAEPDGSPPGPRLAPQYEGQPEYGGQPEYRSQPGYAGQPPASMAAPLVPPRPVQAAPEEEAITIVFKNGRPPMQVRNYILTRSALYLTGAHFNEIPLSDVDLVATQQVNWNAGVTFRLP